MGWFPAHFYDGSDDLVAPCAECGKPYETGDERHNFDKVWWFDNDGIMHIKPYTKVEYDAEMAELARIDPDHRLPWNTLAQQGGKP